MRGDKGMRRSSEGLDASIQWGMGLSIFAYICFSIIKCWVGAVTQSQAVIADGLNNIADILLSIAMLVGMKVSMQPADHDHPYGHRKAETIATLVAASFMVLVAIHVWLDAFHQMWVPSDHVIPALALWVSFICVIPMGLIFLLNLFLSKKTGNQALRAAAWDNGCDALVSLGAGLGIWGSQLGYSWMDPLAAFVVGFFILRTGWKMGRPAVHMLMDGYDQDQLVQIKQRVNEVEGIHLVRTCRARCYGSHVFVEVTVGVDPTLSVSESHDLTEKIERRLKGYQNIRDIHIHVEPSYPV